MSEMPISEQMKEKTIYDRFSASKLMSDGYFRNGHDIFSFSLIPLVTRCKHFVRYTISVNVLYVQNFSMILSRQTEQREKTNNVVLMWTFVYDIFVRDVYWIVFFLRSHRTFVHRNSFGFCDQWWWWWCWWWREREKQATKTITYYLSHPGSD